MALGFLLGRLSGGGIEGEHQVYATLDGTDVTSGEITPGIRLELASLEKAKYDLKRKAILSFLQQKKPNSFKSIGHAGESMEPSAEEVNQSLKAYGLRPSAMKPGQLRDFIGNLKLKREMDARMARDREALLLIRWGMAYPWATAPLELAKSPFPEIGSRLSRVRVDVVGGFRCPQCPQLEKSLQQIRSRYGDGVRIAYRFGPDLNRDDILFAEAAYCANALDRFWALRDVIAQSSVADVVGEIAHLGGQAGIPGDALEACLASAEHKERIRDDSEELRRKGVFSGSLLINGHVVSGLTELSDIFAMIDGERI